MADFALNLMFTAGFAVGMGLGDGEHALSEPYEGWENEFLPLQLDVHTLSEEDNNRHGNGLFGVEPGVRVGAWQLAVPVEATWLDWRTEAMALAWWTRTYTDTRVYEFKQPTIGLSAGRWVGGVARPYATVSAFRWEQRHNTYQGAVNELGQVSYGLRSSERLDDGWGGHAELGVVLQEAIHDQQLAFVQGIRFAARGSRLDGYSVLSLRVTWALGADYHRDAGTYYELDEPSGSEQP